MTDDEEAVYEVHRLIRRWGFNRDFFRIHGLTADRFAIRKIIIIEEEIEEWRTSQSDSE